MKLVTAQQEMLALTTEEVLAIVTYLNHWYAYTLEHSLEYEGYRDELRKLIDSLRKGAEACKTGGMLF